jgi:hypothetical protein
MITICKMTGGSMTINLLIQYKNATLEEADFIPVSGQESYRRNWLPLCNKLGLPLLVRAYESGVEILSCIPEFADELQRLKDYILSAPSTEISTKLAEEMVRRIEILLQKVEYIRINVDKLESADLG